MNRITVNGTTIEVPDGASVNVTNGHIVINGKEQMSGLSGVVKVVVEGKIEVLNASCDVEVHGDVGGNIDAGCGINCGNVGGNADAGTSINCGNIAGDADAGTSIRCASRDRNRDAYKDGKRR